MNTIVSKIAAGLVLVGLAACAAPAPGTAASQAPKPVIPEPGGY